MKKNNVKFSDAVLFLTEFKDSIKSNGLKKLFLKKINPEEYKNNYPHISDKFDNYAWFKLTDKEVEKISNTSFLFGVIPALNSVMTQKLQSEVTTLWDAAVNLQGNEKLSQETRDRLADLLINFHDTGKNINVQKPSMLNTLKCLFTNNFNSYHTTMSYQASVLNDEWESWKRMNMVVQGPK